MTMSPDRRKRPLLVALIAIYQFFIGCVGLVYFARAWMSHAGDVRALLIDNPLSFVILVFGVVAFVIGIGVWCLQPWARHFLLFTTAVAMARGLKQYAMGGWALRYQHAIAPYIVIDLVIWLTLMYYPDVAAAFGERNGESSW